MVVGLAILLTYSVSITILIFTSRLPETLAAANLPSYEITALHDIYTSTNGDNWLWGLQASYFPGIPWNFSGNPNPCMDIWQGINCTSTSINNYVHVSGIDLAVMFLEGTLPDSIGMFPMLQKLFLSANLITGTLPGTLSNLTNLQILDISSNVFHKKLPGTLGVLVNLVELYVQNNIFTGPLPELGNLTQLTQLNYANNFINESLSSSFGNLLELQVFIAENNMLTGSIPESFGQLDRLTQLDLSYNTLSGSLPDSLGQLVNLQTFSVNSNFITGEIPSSLGNWSQLTTLQLYSNFLDSSIPPSFGAMASLHTLSLQANYLHGTIPSSLCNITGLLGLRAMNNILTGQIPACLVLNPALNTLVLYNNRLSGPLPDIYAPDSQLSFIDVNGLNFLTGTLPPALGQLSNLEYLYAGLNQFTGPIPASFGNISTLLGIYIKYNALTGTLPPELASLQSAIFLEVSGNHLTGTLPEVWATLTGLHELHVDQNRLTGTVPNSYMDLVMLQVLNVYKNMLHGTIPNTVDQLTLVQYIGFDFNQFTGTLPASVGNISTLVSLEVNGNRLTGRLPSSLRNLTRLTTLLVNDNHLTGTLDEVFDSSRQTGLNIIQLSNNAFTGYVPEEPFRIQQLMTFAAVGNCFEGSLPQAACGSSNLQVLALSGLQSSPACQTLLLPGIAKSYISKSPISGGIPACLFEMPRLVQLQLSGNGLTGSLPDNVNINSYLVDVTLSHNTLSGTIPMVFQTREWLTFDLSYNRMYGTLSRHLETEPSPRFNLSYARSALSLQNNRLSGEIPNSVKPMLNISVLSGNLFNCNLMQTNLPDHDPAVSNYQCGSTTFDVPYYLWLALTVTLAAFCLTAWLYRDATVAGWLTSYVQILLAWYFVLVRCSSTAEVCQRYPMLNTRYLTTLFNSINKIAQICAVYTIVVLMPLYAVLSTYSNTLQHQYAYSSSAAFHKGKVATALEMVFLILLQCVALGACVYYWKAPDARVVQQAKRSASVQAKTAQSSLLSRLAVYCALIGTNMFVVFGVNIAYVYVALYESSSFLLVTQILLSMFKLGWNKFCGSSLIPWTARYISPSVTTDLQSSTVEFFPLQLFLSLFNNIAIPCVVVAVVNPNCFSYAFSNSPSVTVQYIVDQCDVLNDETDQCDSFIKQVESTTFNPPFTYSYQCSASFVTYYAPAFVIMCIMSTFAVPALQSVLVLMYNRQAGILSRKGVVTWRFRLLDALLPRLLKPPTALSTTSFALNTVVAAAQETDRGTVLLQRDIYSPHFPANQVLLNMLTFLGILMTFGAVFPPLAVALAGTVVGTAVYARLKMGRFLTAALDQRQFKFLDLVDKECAGVGTLGMLVTGVFMLLSFSCAFYTLFLFDALGDSVGFNGAYWVLIFVPLVPMVMYGIYCAYIAHAARHTAELTTLSSTGIELRQSTVLTSAAADGLVAATAGQGSSPTASVTSQDSEHKPHTNSTKEVLSTSAETGADTMNMLHRNDSLV